MSDKNASALLVAYSFGSAVAGRARASTLNALKQSLKNPDHGWIMTATSVFESSEASQVTYQIASSVKEATIILTLTESLGRLGSIVLSYQGTTLNVTDDELAALLKEKGKALSENTEAALNAIFE